MLQYLYSIIAILQSMDLGICIGWSMPASVYLMREHPRKVGGNEDQDLVSGFSKTTMSWVFSAQGLTIIIVCLIFGHSLNKFSIKSLIMYFGFCKIIFWIIALFGDTTPIYIILSRCFFGLSLILLGCIPLYIEEITEVTHRGSFISFFDVALNLGIIFAYTIGSLASFAVNLWVFFIFSSLSWSLCFFLPETPIYLKEKGHTEKTLQVLKKIRPKNHNFNQELDDINNYIQSRHKSSPSFLELILLLKCHSHYRKSLFMINLLFMMQHLSGMTILQNYSIDLINKYSTLNEYLVMISSGITACVGSILASCLTDRYGRRPLLLLSVGTVTLCLGCFALFIFKIFTFSYIPIIAFSCHVFMMNIGLGPLPFVIMTELLPYQIRYWGSYLGVLALSIIAFLVNNTFYILQEWLGGGWLFTIYTFINFLGFLWIYFFIPETKGIPRHLMEHTIFLKNNLEHNEAEIPESEQMLNKEP